MGESSATSLISRLERYTMPIAIYRFLGRPGAANYGQALAMSMLLMLVCLIVAPSVKLSLQTGTTICGKIVHYATGRWASAFHKPNRACRGCSAALSTCPLLRSLFISLCYA
jgi:hypothetical protein